MANFLTGLQNMANNLASGISTYEIRRVADKVQNVVMNYTETESKVREATNEDPWGPTGPLMAEVAQFTYQYESFPEVMGSLWKRMLHENKRSWRRVYKSLILLNYLIKNGAEKVTSNAREHLFDLRMLENYQFVDENGKDQGINIRHRVKEIIELLQDDDRIRKERKQAKQVKNKYGGISSNDFGSRSFYSTDSRSFGSNGEPSFSRRRNSLEESYKDFDDEPNDYKDYDDSKTTQSPVPNVPKSSSSYEMNSASPASKIARSYVPSSAGPKLSINVAPTGGAISVKLPAPPSPQGTFNNNSSDKGDLLFDVFDDGPKKVTVPQDPFEVTTPEPSDFGTFASFADGPNKSVVASKSMVVQSQDDFADFSSFASNKAEIPHFTAFTSPSIDQSTTNLIGRTHPQNSACIPIVMPVSDISPMTSTNFNSTSSSIAQQPVNSTIKPNITQTANNLKQFEVKNTTWASDLSKVNIDLDNLCLNKNSPVKNKKVGGGLTLKQIQEKQINISTFSS
uniref:ENTH domain-containing protein n=1 Tax=Romanomermis culicivorax TaxID=13658 RepID=A0A915KWA4_ROMCU